MKRHVSWFVFAAAPVHAFRYFERRRPVSLARLATVTRELRAAMEQRSAGRISDGHAGIS